MATHYQPETPQPETPSSSCLVGQSDRFAGRRLELASPSLLLGRGDDCDLVVDDPQVSRHHARLTWQAGSWFVEDLGSTNGTRVNSMSVTGQRHLLNPGGLLSLGGVIFKLEMTGLEDTIVAQPPRPQPAVPPPTAPIPRPPSISLQPETAAGGESSPWATLGGAGVLILGLIMLALVGVAAWLLLRPGVKQAGDLRVSIDAPPNGTQVAEGNTLTIVATATDPEGLSRLEIWIDDALAQVTPAETSSLAVTYPWTAHTPGSHLIIARAYNTDGQSSDDLATITVTGSESAGAPPTPDQSTTTGPTSEAGTAPTLTPGPGTSVADETIATHTLQPTYTPQPTYTLAPQSAPLGLFNDFETPTSWNRGDQANGTFERSDAQAHSGGYSGHLSYNFPSSGNDFVVFMWSQALDGQPDQIRAWVYGDGSGHFLNAWVKDNAGQTWQFTFGQAEHTGWEQMTAYIDPDQPWPTGHISGPDNGVVDYPISFQALVFDDVPDAYGGNGDIYVDDLESIYAGSPAPATPTSTPGAEPLNETPTPSAPSSIDFRADRTTLDADECTTLRWDVENVREVYLDDDGVAGHGTRGVCPPATTTYTLHVILTDGSSTDRELTITVTEDGPPSAPSNLSIAVVTSNGFGLSFTDNSGGTADGFRLYNANTITLMQEYPAAAAPNLPISGLNCGTTYRMALTAFNDSGESGPSNVVEGTTQSCP
jgi:hypothetical protein